MNLHLLESESDTIRERWALTPEENAEGLFAIAALQDRTGLSVQPILDMARLLLGTDESDGGVSCIWNACDPYTTDAVRGVLGDGTRANCGRTNKDGVNWVKADEPSRIRQLALYQTPYADGGCQDCRFFFACKGQCPGTSIDGDWRQRTEHCETLLIVFGQLERQLLRMGLRPISADPARRVLVEERLLEGYRAGVSQSVAAALRGRPIIGLPDTPHGDQAHQDTPHGDQHEDHTDVAAIGCGEEADVATA